jgi:hypothetical protein
LEKLLNEEFLNMFSSPNMIGMIKSRSMRLAEHVACMGEKRNAYGVMVGRTEDKRPIGRPRRT